MRHDFGSYARTYKIADPYKDEVLEYIDDTYEIFHPALNSYETVIGRTDSPIAVIIEDPIEYVYYIKHCHLWVIGNEKFHCQIDEDGSVVLWPGKPDYLGATKEIGENWRDFVDMNLR